MLPKSKDVLMKRKMQKTGHTVSSSAADCLPSSMSSPDYVSPTTGTAHAKTKSNCYKPAKIKTKKVAFRMDTPLFLKKT